MQKGNTETLAKIKEEIPNHFLNSSKIMKILVWELEVTIVSPAISMALLIYCSSHDFNMFYYN